MYRKNNLARPVLITVDEVLAKAATDENADIRFLNNSIEIAEERFIAPALGDNFYEDFINRKNVLVTSVNQAAMVTAVNASLALYGKNPISASDLPVGCYVNAIELCPSNYQTLWTRFLWKIVAEAVDIVSIVPSWTRSTAQGQQQNNPKTLSSDGAGSATADRKDIEFKIDTMMQQRLYPLIARMKKWIAQQGTFTLFQDPKRKEDGVNTQMKGGIILGLYEDKSQNGPDLWQLGHYFYDDDRDRSCGGGQPSPAPAPPPAEPAQDWRSIELLVVTTPDPLDLIPVGPASAGLTIQKQYAPGATITPMKIGDASGYLAGRPYQSPIFLNGLILPSTQYNSSTGTFTGGFNDGDVIIITFKDNV